MPSNTSACVVSAGIDTSLLFVMSADNCANPIRLLLPIKTATPTNPMMNRHKIVSNLFLFTRNSNCRFVLR